MNTPLDELRRHLNAERQWMEYWRASELLKLRADHEAEQQPRRFTPTKPPPRALDKDALAQRYWTQLYKEFDCIEPHSIPLNAVSGIGTAVVFMATAVMVSQLYHPVIGILIGIIVAATVAGAGFGLTWHTRHKDIVAQVEEVFDDRFSVHWSEALARHELRMNEYWQAQLRHQAAWDEDERQRVRTYRDMNSDPEVIKAKIAAQFGMYQYLSLESQVASNDGQLSIVFKIPILKDVVASKTKVLSDKTGKVISKSKSREDKEAEYAWFAAGTGLKAVVEILNAAPFCERLQIALYSEDKSRQCYHVCGEVDRGQLPTFSWATVNPVSVLKNLGFRTEGGNAKKLTSKPDWLERLDRVRIDISEKPTLG